MTYYRLVSNIVDINCISNEEKLGEIDLVLICSDKYDDEIYNNLLDKGVNMEKLYKITAIN